MGILPHSVSAVETQQPSLRGNITGNLEAGGTNAGFAAGTLSPIVIAVRIINGMLTLLGTVFVVLIVYAGFLWLTAGGNDDKVHKARGIIQGAVIGLLIILSAFAITRFVVGSLSQAL